MSNPIFISKTFDQLSTSELYNILKLRSEVFVVEQNCVFLDLDDKDQIATHCFLTNFENEILAYTRLFDKNKYYKGFASIGRVVSSPNYRKDGYGKKIMKLSTEKISELFGDVSIKIGAQSYLEKFYNSLGFISINEDYIEDGIPHKIMIRN